jgi:diamine N-acetyltransferase
MNISFSAALPEHLPSLVSMMKELQADDPWSCHFDENEAGRTMDELLRNPSVGRVWLIAADSETVGYIVMSFDYSLEYRGKNAWVDEFYIRRTHRGLGIGGKALDHFAEQARELGMKAVHLGVNHGNRAIELYRRKGFEDRQLYLMTRWIAERP